MTVPAVVASEIGLASLLGNASVVFHNDGSIEFLAAGAATINGASIGTGTGNPIANNRLLGNISGATAAPAALTAAQVRTLLALAAIATSGSGADLAAASVANAALANVSTATFKGRTTAGSGSPEDLSVAQAKALLGVFTDVLTGLVPASGGGTSTFLRADGTFAAPTLAQTAHGVRCYASADQGTTNNVQLSPLLWDSEDWDTDAFHSTSSNKGRLTCPTGLDGYYLVDAFLYWQSNNNGGRDARIDQFAAGGGAPVVPTIIGDDRAFVSGASNYQHLCGMVKMAAGEYVQLSVVQSSGGNLNVLGTQGASTFGMQYLGA